MKGFSVNWVAERERGECGEEEAGNQSLFLKIFFAKIILDIKVNHEKGGECVCLARKGWGGKA